MLFKHLLIPILALIGTLSADPQEIRVHLLSETKLSPIYLSEITTSQATLPKTYLLELEKIINYDFSYNGKTSVLQKSPERETSLRAIQNGNAMKHNLGAVYACAFCLEGKNLQTTVYDLHNQTVKTFPPIPLSGILSEDRNKIHLLSDAIHKALFHCEGIASAKILFSYQSKVDATSWHAEIAECDADGENLKILTQENSYCVTPVAIPKGNSFDKDLFLYVCYKTGQPKIFITEKGKRTGTKVSDIRGNQVLPAISPRRDKLAFICDASGRTDLFIQTLDPKNGKVGTPQQLFSYPRSTQASPTFNPDGSKIAFVSDKDGSPRIYCIHATPTEKRQSAQMLTKKNKENTCPCWSPDGTKLAYSAKTEGVRQIWIYDFTTQEEKQLTSGPGDKENPCFAPNSCHIVFNSTDGCYSDLYVVNLYQPNAIKITKGTGKKHYPVWSSR